jgi:glucose-6-phosphate 1-dehydrogenase
MAALLNLSIPPELRSGVIANFEHIQKIAKPVVEFPLGETLESAATFEP